MLVVPFCLYGYDYNNFCMIECRLRYELSQVTLLTVNIVCKFIIAMQYFGIDNSLRKILRSLAIGLLKIPIFRVSQFGCSSKVPLLVNRLKVWIIKSVGHLRYSIGQDLLLYLKILLFSLSKLAKLHASNSGQFLLQAASIDRSFSLFWQPVNRYCAISDVYVLCK